MIPFVEGRLADRGAVDPDRYEALGLEFRYEMVRAGGGGRGTPSWAQDEEFEFTLNAPAL